MTTETYRAASDARPRIWVPGLVMVDVMVDAPTGRLRVGAGATSWDERDGLDDPDRWRWRHRETYVVTADLEERERHVEALAEWPRLAALAASAPIRSARDAVARPEVRLISLWFSPDADGLLSILVERSGHVLKSVAGSLSAFAQNETDRFELHARVLRAATEGLVDERSLALAALVERAIGAPWSVTAELRALRDDLERELAEIEARATAMRVDAVEIERRLREASPEDDRVAIPLYGVARRRRHVALVVRSSDRDRVAITDDLLELPAEDEWLVDDVAPWEPPTRALRVHRERAHERKALRARRFATAFVLLVLAAAFVLAVVLRRQSQLPRRHCATVPAPPAATDGSPSELSRAACPSSRCRPLRACSRLPWARRSSA